MTVNPSTRTRIDLRSDTCSRPTEAMREAIARADVGDDVYGDDPTVKALEAETARLLGKEDAVFMPTGTMTNQVGIRLHTQQGDAALFEQSAHVYLLEGGGPAAISGVLPRLIPGERGIFSADQVAAAVGAPHPFFPLTVQPPIRLLCVENTHNLGGGSVWPLDEIAAVADAGRGLGLATHLDGARLWHATAATGVAEAEYAAPFDTVSVCFSKALGAPVGSCLAGPRELMDRARRFKQGFGGGFRQAGIIAAGALHALHRHRELLGDGRAIWSMFKKVPKSELVIARSNGLWTVVSVGGKREPTTDDRVLRAITEGGKNPDEIATALSISSRAVSNAIARLRKDGLIAKGHPYELTDAGHEALA